MLSIRKETRGDRQAVEAVTRRAFYNVYVPGCTEHYLVHIMREHPDFIPELALVAELDGRVLGNVVETRAPSPGGAILMVSGRVPNTSMTLILSIASLLSVFVGEGDYL